MPASSQSPKIKHRLSIQSSDLYEIAKSMAEDTDIDESDSARTSPEKAQEEGTPTVMEAASTRAAPRSPSRRVTLVQQHRSHKSVLYADEVSEAARHSSWSPMRRVELQEARRRIREANLESDTSDSSTSSDEDSDDENYGSSRFLSKKFISNEDSTLYSSIGGVGITPEEKQHEHHHRHHHHHHHRHHRHNSNKEGVLDKMKKLGVVHGLRETIVQHAKRVLPSKTKKTFKLDKSAKSMDYFVSAEYVHFEEEDLFSNGREVRERYKFQLNWAQRIFVFMEHPNSSKASWMLSIFISVVTFASVLIYICASIPEVLHEVDTCSQPACNDDAVLCANIMVCEPEPPEWFRSAESACLYIFVVDYFLRFFLVTCVSPRVAGISTEDIAESDDWTITTTHIHRRENGAGYTNEAIWYYETHIMNVVDLIAILPFFIEASGLANGHTLSIIRVLRLARILRVLKLGKGSKGVQVLLATMVASFPAILILGFFSLIGITLLGALQYFFEGGTFTVSEAFPQGEYLIQDKTASFVEPSKFNSIPMAMYWSIISSTGVGFGDIVPSTYAGRFIAIVAMYGGILVLALPISVIGNNFERIYDQSKGHLSYGVVNSILELMEDDQELDDLIQECTVDANLYVARRHLIEHRASKLACVYVIAHVCLKAAEAEDINVLLSKVGLREIISALEYVYDLEFRNAQLTEFVRSTVSDEAVEWDIDDPQGSYEGLKRGQTPQKDEEARLKLLQAKIKKSRNVRATAEHLLIGTYEYGKDEVEVDWQKIEDNEMELYDKDYHQLNTRAKEVVRYLRKAPHDRPAGWLELQAAECKKEFGILTTEKDLKHDASARMRELDNHPLKLMDRHTKKMHESKRRVHLAYKRLEMAMHAVELENNALRTEKWSEITKSRKASNNKSIGSNISSDSDIDVEVRDMNTPQQKIPFINSPETEVGLTPGTDYRHRPSGNTPLPNDAGSPWVERGSVKSDSSSPAIN
eukprot:GSChrysophyteH2.ASY1.ANO1.1762.1 assembled CDS